MAGVVARSRLSWLIIPLGCLLGSRSLSAQTPADRNILSATLSPLAAGGRADTTRCHSDISDVTRLCQAITLLSGDRGDHIKASDLAVRAVLDQGKWPYAWLILGTVRLQLARDSALSREGPAEGTGMSNVLGAADAFEEALKVEPDFIPAANALALTPEPREGVAALTTRLAVLRRARSLLSGPGLAGAAIIERDAGSTDSAIALEQRALAKGDADSGLVYLSLARDYHHVGKPGEGYKALIAGAGIASSVAKAAYRSELSWVASAVELQQWDTLPAPARPAWVARFWATRDVRDGWPAGARLTEHYRRIEYAMAHFRVALPETGRQRMLSFTGSDALSVQQHGADYAIRHPDLCPDAARFVESSRLLGADSPHRYYQPVQDLVDDRGVVYIRQGPPNETRSSHSGDIVEIWRYNRPEGPLVLQFRAADFEGSSGASVLIPSLLSLAPGIRTQVCELEVSLCPNIERSGELSLADTLIYPAPLVINNAYITPEAAQRMMSASDRLKAVQGKDPPKETCLDPYAKVLERMVVAEANLTPANFKRAEVSGLEQMQEATSTDAYRRDFAKALHPLVQVYGLDRATDHAPRLVLGFALPGHELGFVKRDSTSGAVVYPVQMHVSIAALDDGARHDVDTLRQFLAAAPMESGQFISGVLDVPVPAGKYAVTVVFSQADAHGAEASMATVQVPSGTGGLQVSDLVLGRENGAARWNSGTSVVWLNPLNTFPAKSSVAAYFQLAGLKPGINYKTTFQFFRADDDAKHAPRLAVSSNDQAPHDRMEVARNIGLQSLPVGKYRVRVIVEGDGATTTAESWLDIVK